MTDREPDFTGAKCRSDEPDSFYPLKGSAQVAARHAKAVCNGEDGRPECPARAVCLEYALQQRERFGIWGGKSERERARLIRDRRVAAAKELLEVEAARQKRAAAARRGWENRRRREVEDQEHAAAAATRTTTRKKTTGAIQEARRRRAA